MALWQVDFFVLPKDAFEVLSLVSYPSTDEDNCFDDAIFWLEEKISLSFFNSIANVLPITKSWHEDLTIFGSLESNCFEVLCKKNIAVSVSFRIDYTSEYELILRGFIQFFILNNLIVLTEDLIQIPLNFEVIKSTIENSQRVQTYRMLSS